MAFCADESAARFADDGVIALIEFDYEFFSTANRAAVIAFSMGMAGLSSATLPYAELLKRKLPCSITPMRLRSYEVAIIETKNGVCENHKSANRPITT